MKSLGVLGLPELFDARPSQTFQQMLFRFYFVFHCVIKIKEYYRFIELADHALTYEIQQRLIKYLRCYCISHEESSNQKNAYDSLASADKAGYMTFIRRPFSRGHLAAERVNCSDSSSMFLSSVYASCSV